MKALIFITVLFLTLSCQRNEVESSIVSQNITPVLIGTGIYSGNAVQSNLVISNQSDWLQMLTLLTPINTNDFINTNIDFNNFQLLVVIDTIRPSTGFSINISSVIESNLIISVTISSVNNGNGYTVFSQPFCIVKIPKSIKPVEFQ